MCPPQSSNGATATVSVASATVTTPDTEGLTARRTFEVTIPNRVPVAVGTIADMEVAVDGYRTTEDITTWPT